MVNDKIYMARCIDLAKNGLGSASPNPMVGCVITYNGKIIGEGYHKKAGEAHAEVNAINSVKDKNLLPKSTLYVNLEPCAHYGKTPPCSDLIIENKIPRVVIGSVDPNPQVSGKGIKLLREAGCEVILDVLKEQCSDLNRRFFQFHQNKMPYIILKWAQTKDGFIDIIRNPDSIRQPTWISDETCRLLVHKWRSEEDAILVGTNTALLDNPDLTVHNWTGKNPLRLIPDRNLSLPKDLKIFNQATRTVVYNASVSKLDGNTEYKAIDFNNAIHEILIDLYTKNILSIIVEGGGKLLTSFLQQGLWNEARIFISDKVFKKGIIAPQIDNDPKETLHIGNSTLFMFSNTN